MTLFLISAIWYLAVIGLVAASVHLGRQRRKAAEEASLDESYEVRRTADRSEHLARVRREELDEMRRAAQPRRWPTIGLRA